MIGLLIIAALVGICAALIGSTLSMVRAKHRDEARIADLQHIQQSLELYHADNGNYPDAIYPEITAGKNIYLKPTPRDPQPRFSSSVNQYGYVVQRDPATHRIIEYAAAAALEHGRAGATLSLVTPTVSAGNGVFMCTAACPGSGGTSGWVYQVTNR